MNEWNDDWRNTIEEAIGTRLAECRNTAMDIVEMASEVHKYNPIKTAAECFEYMIEWVCDANNQWQLYDKIDSHYDWYLSRVA